MTRSDPSFTSATPPRATVVVSAVAVFLLAWIAVSPAKAAERCASGDAGVLAQSASGRIAFGDKMRTVRLAATCGPIGTAVRRTTAKARFFLVVEDLRASTQPGAIFDIALAPPGGRRAGHTHMLGTLNFFNAHPAAAGKGRRMSYDVTEALRGLAGRDHLASGIVLAIAPMSAPERRSDASAGAIKLVVQGG